MLDEVISAWRTHDRINRLLIEKLPEGGLRAIPLLKTGEPGRGRDVGRQLAHMIEVRISHLRVREKGALKDVPPFEKGATPTAQHLLAALAGSSAGIELRLAAAADGDLVRGHGPVRLLSYLVSHESHHRGQVLLALKQSGLGIPEELRWAIWEMWMK